MNDVKIDQIKHDIGYFESLKHDMNIAYAECFVQESLVVIGNLADIIRHAIYTAEANIKNIEKSNGK